MSFLMRIIVGKIFISNSKIVSFYRPIFSEWYWVK